jgi:hypothetical protein
LAHRWWAGKDRLFGIGGQTKLQALLEKDVGIIDPSLMVIGRQVPTAFGKVIDLLAIDAEGHLVVVELKRDKTPRDVVAQAIDYASWVQDLAYDDITAIYASGDPSRRFEQAFAERFETDPPAELNEDHRMVIVASALDTSTERIINYLSSGYGVPINVVFFRYFKEGQHEYLTRTWLIDPNQAEAQSDKSKARTARGKEPWNGRDFYVSFGEDRQRAWEDAREYGFISAGGGRWYSHTLSMLSPGARVFVCIPKRGYVGVGIVKEAVVPISEFKVRVRDAEMPILDAPVKAPAMGEAAGNPDLSEYLVRVEWLKTLSLDKAIWEKGMFANQNSVCKLRNKFTLERLAAMFHLED